MKQKKHLIRAACLLFLGFVGASTGRLLLIPPTYGEEGHYRYAAVLEGRQLPRVHGGRESCADCHEEQYKKNQGSEHKVVQCEACHEPVTRHADPSKRDGPDKGKIAEMPINKTWRLCARCHQKLQARPEAFRQVDILEHVKENGADFAVDICFECHNPHAPED